MLRKCRLHRPTCSPGECISLMIVWFLRCLQSGGVCHSSSLWHHLLLELASFILVCPFQFRMLSFCDSRFQLAVSEDFSTQPTKAAEKQWVRTGRERVPPALTHME